MKQGKTARRLTETIEKLGMSPSELAKRSGVTKASISQYMNGIYSPSEATSKRLADVLHVSHLWLMGYDVPQTNIVPDEVPEKFLKETAKVWRRAEKGGEERMTKLVYSASEAAAAMQTSQASLLQLLEAGEIPAYREGRNWKIPIRALEDYVLNRAKDEADARRHVEREISQEEMREAINRLP